MGARVRAASPDGVVLTAPLGPNINHYHSAFGGSVSAVGILAGWTLVFTRLAREGVEALTVIQRSEVSYLGPIRDDFEARALPVRDDAWRRFLASLRRWGRGRIRVQVELWCAGVLAGRAHGDYVALAEEGAPS